MKIWYLYHSGVAVRTERQLLVFDYWQNRTLPEGIPALFRKEDCPVTVFVSHAHGDHFNPGIFSWREAWPEITYVLSSDVPARPGCIQAPPDAELKLPGCTVRTLRSTDEGVAFLVEADGAVIYHAGDLHWWHWEGEPEADNRAMAAAYCREIDRLRDTAPDVAFVPVDPRQEEDFALGIDYFASQVRCPRLIPIHFSSDETVLQRLEQRPGPSQGRLCLLSLAHPFAQWQSQPGGTF